jgi:hypothetical protein
MGAPRILTCLGALFMFLQPLAAAFLSPLAPAPEWSRLDDYQRTLTRTEFLRLLNNVYSPDGGFLKFCQLGDDRLILFSDTARRQPLFTFYFAEDENGLHPRPVHYAPERKPAVTAATEGKPLSGIHICLDPGHIGGEWSRLEERYFKLGNDAPVEEAELNWITCKLIEKQLLALGARVSWAKPHNEPATSQRPGDLRDTAIQSLAEHSPRPLDSIDPVKLRRFVDDRANILFYRSAEIYARGKKVERLAPDLTLCIHYNAESWGNPDNPQLVARSRLVAFVCGAFAESELYYDDQKFNLLCKLLANTAPLERRGAECIQQEMLNRFKMSAEEYPGWNMVRKIGPVPGVFARNLLASRIYPGPVVFVEGPFMNARDAYSRLIAGDYEGTRQIDGVEQISIYREYADAVVAGLLKYCAQKMEDSVLQTSCLRK